jgi:hypothetical protein
VTFFDHLLARQYLALNICCVKLLHDKCIVKRWPFFLGFQPGVPRVMVKVMAFGAREMWTQIPDPLFNSSVNLG